MRAFSNPQDGSYDTLHKCFDPSDVFLYSAAIRAEVGRAKCPVTCNKNSGLDMGLTVAQATSWKTKMILRDTSIDTS